MECKKNLSKATTSPLQRSRSSTTSSRLHSTNAPPPLSSRSMPTSPKPKPRKENLPSSNAAISHVDLRRPLIPSAWALSPGRSLAGPVSTGEKKKKNGGMMGLLLTRRRKKEDVFEKEEAAHRLRLMMSRLMQWRFVNARASTAANRVRSSVEVRPTLLVTSLSSQVSSTAWWQYRPWNVLGSSDSMS